MKSLESFLFENLTLIFEREIMLNKIHRSLNDPNYISIKELIIKYGIKKINGNEYINLCLYYPGEWNSTMNISDTIIPWISEWLYYFEFWSITGKWCGGGKHPTKRDTKENDKS